MTAREILESTNHNEDLFLNNSQLDIIEKSMTEFASTKGFDREDMESCFKEARKCDIFSNNPMSKPKYTSFDNFINQYRPSGNGKNNDKIYTNE